MLMPLIYNSNQISFESSEFDIDIETESKLNNESNNNSDWMDNTTGITPGNDDRSVYVYFPQFLSLENIPNDVSDSYFNGCVAISIDGTGNCMCECADRALKSANYTDLNYSSLRDFVAETRDERTQRLDLLDETEIEAIFCAETAEDDNNDLRIDRSWRGASSDEVFPMISVAFGINWIF